MNYKQQIFKWIWNIRIHLWSRPHRMKLSDKDWELDLASIWIVFRTEIAFMRSPLSEAILRSQWNNNISFKDLHYMHKLNQEADLYLMWFIYIIYYQKKLNWVIDYSSSDNTQVRFIKYCISSPPPRRKTSSPSSERVIRNEFSESVLFSPQRRLLKSYHVSF